MVVLGLEELVNCNYNSFSLSSCGDFPTSCDQFIPYVNCLNKLISSACGKEAAMDACEAETVIKESVPNICSDKSINCNKANSSPVFSIQTVTMFVSILLPFLY